MKKGDTETTYTTTKVWKKDAPSAVTPVSPVGNSGILTLSVEEAGAQGSAMHTDPNSEYSNIWIGEDGETINGYGWKAITVQMSDGSIWYSVEFYQIEL